jgi:hypothetical protein
VLFSDQPFLLRARRAILNVHARPLTTIEGFRTIFRRPSSGFAELAWRWSFGAALLATLAFLLTEYFDTLPVNRTEMLLLGTHQPSLIAQAIAGIFRGTAPRFFTAIAALAFSMGLVWICIGSVARIAIVRSLISYFDTEASRARRANLRAIVGLNTFRFAVTCAAGVGCLALGPLAIAAKTELSPAAAFFTTTALTCLVFAAWAAVNWFLSLATIFAARGEVDTFAAIGAAAHLCASRFGAVLAPGTWFGLLHGAAFCIAGVLSFFVLALSAGLPEGGVLLALAVALAYFAIADFLYAGRMAAYIFLIEGLDTLPVAAALAPSPSLRPPPEQTRVDPDELILSDFPAS